MSPKRGRSATVFVGDVFSRLTVTKENGRIRGKDRAYLCRCECGNHTTVAGYALRNGNTKSCGCLRREKVRHDFATTHGHSKGGITTPTYNSWKAMCDRCRKQNGRAWEWYGGRGITVHPTWRGPGGFEQFLADMGEKLPETSLDRIDVNGNYEPGNCRWATREEQARNKRPPAHLAKIAELERLVEAQQAEIARLQETDASSISKSSSAV